MGFPGVVYIFFYQIGIPRQVNFYFALHFAKNWQDFVCVSNGSMK